MDIADVMYQMDDTAKFTRCKSCKVMYYQIALWLQELQEFRDKYEPELHWDKIDRSTEEMIKYNIDKRGSI